jgi:hypothetical protein
MTRALQAVPTALRGEAMDAIQEYSGYFRQLGFDGASAMGVIVSAVENGQYGIDKMGDALKEFTIRSTDMSTTSVAAYKTLGLNAHTMADDLLAGGTKAQKAFQLIIDRLQGIKDPAKQANTAIALFGTPLEDLGTGKIPKFLASLDPMVASLAEIPGASDDAVAALKEGQDPLEKLKRGFASAASEGFQPVIEYAGKLIGWLDKTPGAMQAVAIGVIALAVAMGILTIAMLAASATPITWIILGIVAAIAALVAVVVIIVKNWDPIAKWFADLWHTVAGAVAAAWDWILDIIGGAWDWLNDNVFSPIGDVVGTVVGWFEDFLGPRIAATWDVITTAASVAWLVLKVIFVTIATAAVLLGEAFMWAWDHLIAPVWDLFKVGAEIAWNWVRDNVLAPIVESWHAVGDAFEWVWDNLISPAWELFRLGLALAWAWIDEHVFGPVLAGWHAVGDGFEWVWDNLISPAWEAVKLGLALGWAWIDEHVFTPVKVGVDLVKQGFTTAKDGVVAAWDWVRNKLMDGWKYVQDKVFSPMHDGVSAIGTVFSKTKDLIGKAWDEVRGVAVKPVNFIIETVYMKGIRATWDRIADSVGLDLHLPAVSPIKLAAGGVLPGYTPGRDVHRFWSSTGGRLDLSGGEAVMVPEWTRAVGGPAAVAAMNRAAKEGTLATGGIIGDVIDAITDPVGAIRDLIAAPVRSLLDRVGGGMVGQIAGGLPMRAVDGLVDTVRGLLSWLPGAGHAGGGVLALPGGAPPVTASGGWRPGPGVVVNRAGSSDLLRRIETGSAGTQRAGATTVIENLTVTVPMTDLAQLRDLNDFLALLRNNTRREG